MKVVQGWFAGTYFTNHTLPKAHDLDSKVVDLLCTGISANSAAHVIEDKAKGLDIIGSKTEGALLLFVEQQLDCRTEKIRKALEESKSIIEQYTFTAGFKRSSTLIKRENQSLQLHCKGGAEIVLEHCTKYMDKNQERMLNDDIKKELVKVIDEMAENGLRTMIVAYKEVNSDVARERNIMESELVVLAVVGIKDPLRNESKAAVEQCKRSGITVRMVTGDNILTAKHIAKECGILDEDGMAMEGAEFRKASDEELVKLLPKLQVLARSTPDDKLKLVQLIRSTNQVVAVTGDGTNDALALKEADVGLAMGLSGTQVAKQAAGIIIMDDNFNSIVKSVLWGRSIYESMYQFLRFDKI